MSGPCRYKDLKAKMGLPRLRSQAMTTWAGGWRSLDAHHAALTAALYTIWSSVVVVLFYLWRITVNDPHHLRNVYYGVQISYVSTLVTHVTLIGMSSFLVLGIQQERCGLVTPWVVANIAFMALESVCCMYSNVLRDHINKKFDVLCKAEIAFFLTRVCINILALWAVMRFLKNLRAGRTYKDPEAVQL